MQGAKILNFEGLHLVLLLLRVQMHAVDHRQRLETLRPQQAVNHLSSCTSAEISQMLFHARDAHSFAGSE